MCIHAYVSREASGKCVSMLYVTSEGSGKCVSMLYVSREASGKYVCIHAVCEQQRLW